MRTVALVFTGMLTVCVNAPAFAAQLPTVAQCHAVAQKRGAGETAGGANHRLFIQQCLAGRIPMAEVRGIPVAVREYREASYEKCHELAEQRGAGEASGARNHRLFTEQCMAGKIPTADVTQIRAQTEPLRKKSEEECNALAQQRGAGVTSGTRNHQRFINQCMAGKVS
jgi:hypothetical protein